MSRQIEYVDDPLTMVLVVYGKWATKNKMLSYKN